MKELFFTVLAAVVAMMVTGALVAYATTEPKIAVVETPTALGQVHAAPDAEVERILTSVIDRHHERITH